MFEWCHTSMSLEGKGNTLAAFVLTALLLMSRVGLRHAGCYYGGFPDLPWNAASLMSGIMSSLPLSFPFYNPGYAQSFGSFAGYSAFSGRYTTGSVPNYSALSYGSFSLPSFTGLTTGSGIPGNFGGFGNIGSVGSLISFSRPLFTRFSLPYSGIIPGGFYGLSFAPNNSFDRPVSSNEPQPPPQNSLDPKPGDENLVRGAVYLRETEIYIMESYPMQVMLEMKGDLPTPCHTLRAPISKPDGQNRIKVELYSLVDPGMACIQVLEPFDVKVSLGHFTEGAYTVWVNGEKVEDFSF